MQLSEQEIIRREALEKIRALGINPYPPEEFAITHSSDELKQGFEGNEESEEYKSVSIAGRIMMKRIMGKASFAVLQDSVGKIQLYVSRDEICEGEDKTMYNDVFKKLLDIGDFIGVKGHLFKTQTGETTLRAKELTILSKSLKPLPIVKEKDGEIYDAFTDPDQRYRQRYVDLTVNPQYRDIFIKRTKMVQTMRDFLNSFGYLEVETPILQPLYGGAAARPFKTHHNTLDMTLYLRIANELYFEAIDRGWI